MSVQSYRKQRLEEETPAGERAGTGGLASKEGNQQPIRGDYTLPCGAGTTGGQVFLNVNLLQMPCFSYEATLSGCLNLVRKFSLV